MDSTEQEIQQMVSNSNGSYTINGLLNIPSSNLIKDDCVRQEEYGKSSN